MSQEEEREKLDDKNNPDKAELHSPMGPLMWLFIPFVLVIIYSAFSH